MCNCRAQQDDQFAPPPPSAATTFTQVVIDPQAQPELHARAERLRSEWVVALTAMLRPRTEPNLRLPTGGVELANLSELKVRGRHSVYTTSRLCSHLPLEALWRTDSSRCPRSRQVLNSCMPKLPFFVNQGAEGEEPPREEVCPSPAAPTTALAPASFLLRPCCCHHGPLVRSRHQPRLPAQSPYSPTDSCACVTECWTYGGQPWRATYACGMPLCAASGASSRMSRYECGAKASRGSCSHRRRLGS